MSGDGKFFVYFADKYLMRCFWFTVFIFFINSMTYAGESCAEVHPVAAEEVSPFINDVSVILAEPMELDMPNPFRGDGICHYNHLVARGLSGSLHPRRASRFRGCQEDQEWMKRIRQKFCRGERFIKPTPEVTKQFLEVLKLPEVFYFTFDGAADFNAEKALSVDPNIVNLSGEENSDLRVGNFNGGKVILSELNELQEGQRSESRYFAGSGFKLTENYLKAIQCARQIDSYLDLLEGLIQHQNAVGYTPPTFVAIGYSNGGIDVINFQNEMGDSMERGVDIAVTIDPVSKALFYHPLQATLSRRRAP